MKAKIFQAVLALVLVITGFTSCAKIQEDISTEPSLPPELFLDSDGDGFNDWFETNIAYSPDVPNDRYIILFEYHPEEEGLNIVADISWQFFVEKGEVPAENIIMLKQEEAIRPNLQNAIAEVAKKSDENDIIFLNIQTHGTPGWIGSHPSYTKEWLEKKHRGEPLPSDHPGITYADIDGWLNKINAKIVIVTIMACYSKTALPILQDGSCPRIVFSNTAREFISALGEDAEYFREADAKYGNGDGYISVGEIGNWKDNDPKWGPDWGILYEKGRSWLESEGYSHISDTSNIAYQIYLTDYTPTE